MQPKLHCPRRSRFAPNNLWTGKFQITNPKIQTEPDPEPSLWGGVWERAMFGNFMKFPSFG